jgi:hypothetical protein
LVGACAKWDVTALADVVYRYPGIETTEIIKCADIKLIMRKVAAEACILPGILKLPVSKQKRAD